MDLDEAKASAKRRTPSDHAGGDQDRDRYAPSDTRLAPLWYRTTDDAGTQTLQKVDAVSSQTSQSVHVVSPSGEVSQSSNLTQHRALLHKPCPKCKANLARGVSTDRFFCLTRGCELHGQVLTSTQLKALETGIVHHLKCTICGTFIDGKRLLEFPSATICSACIGRKPEQRPAFARRPKCAQCRETLAPHSRDNHFACLTPKCRLHGIAIYFKSAKECKSCGRTMLEFRDHNVCTNCGYQESARSEVRPQVDTSEAHLGAVEE